MVSFLLFCSHFKLDKWDTEWNTETLGVYIIDLIHLLLHSFGRTMPLHLEAGQHAHPLSIQGRDPLAGGVRTLHLGGWASYSSLSLNIL